MSRIKQRLAKVFAKIERVIFRQEEKVLQKLEEEWKASGKPFDETYLRKVADVYQTSIRTLIMQFKIRYPKSVRIIGGSFIELRNFLCTDIKERTNSYLDRFGVFFLDAEADPEKYADTFMQIIDDVRADCAIYEKESIDEMDECVRKEERKKMLGNLQYVGWAVLGLAFIIFVTYYGRQSDWSFQVDEATQFKMDAQEIEQDMDEDNLGGAMDKTNEMLANVDEEKSPRDYAYLKNMQGDIFMKFHAMMKAKAQANAEEYAKEHLEQAIDSYQDALEVTPSHKQPVKNAQMNQKIGELCMEMPEMGQPGGSLSDMAQQYAGNDEGLLETAQEVMSLIDQEANIVRSIQSFKNALDMYDANRWPTRNAELHVNLGVAYTMLSQLKQKTPNIRKAMNEFKIGVDYFNDSQYPLTFAIIMNNIAVSYFYLSDYGEVADLLDNAKKAFKVSLRVLEHKNFNQYLYEVELNRLRLDHQAEGMKVYLNVNLPIDNKLEMLAAMQAQFDAEEEALPKPDEDDIDEFEKYEIEFMLLGISRMKLHEPVKKKRFSFNNK